MTASEHSKKMVNLEGQTERSKAWAWSSLRGKPIMLDHGLESSCMGHHTINQEQFSVVLSALHAGLHCVLQQLNGNLHGHNSAFLDVRLDHLAELAALAVLLFAQQIASREMLEAIVTDELRTLRTLSGTGATKDEKDGHFVAGPAGRLARARGSLFNGRHLSSGDVKASLVLCRWGNGLE